MALKREATGVKEGSIAPAVITTKITLMLGGMIAHVLRICRICTCRNALFECFLAYSDLYIVILSIEQ